MGQLGERALRADLRQALEHEPVRAIAEYLAERLKLTVGEQMVQLHFSGGSLRRTDFHAGPVRNDELEHVGR